jgi:hypothetical protein
MDISGLHVYSVETALLPLPSSMVVRQNKFDFASRFLFIGYIREDTASLYVTFQVPMKLHLRSVTDCASRPSD